MYAAVNYFKTLQTIIPKLSGWSKRTSALLRVNPVLEYVAFHQIGEVKSLPLLKRLSVIAQFGL